MRTRSASTALLLDDSGRPGHFVAGPNRPWLDLLTRLLGCSLDRQLAAGRLPESNRLLATRAQWLVSPVTLGQLARSWETVVERVYNPAPPRSPRPPLCRDRIRAAEPDIRELLRALAAPLPTPVRGVAMTSWLLSDGAGPLYNTRSRTNLPATLREAITQLDPSSPLMTATDRENPIHRH